MGQPVPIRAASAGRRVTIFLNGILMKRMGLEVAKLNALEQDAGNDWAAVSAGRHSDVEDDELEAFFGKLGCSATLLSAY